MSIVEDLKNLVEIWKERRAYLRLQAIEAFDIKDMKLQATLINNRKQIGNCVMDLQEVLEVENQRDKSWKESCKELENVLNAGRMY